jgi:UDP-3-O-[3-hydroxymyristoyl] N-acetylglucosamine deacetylase
MSGNRIGGPMGLPEARPVLHSLRDGVGGVAVGLIQPQRRERVWDEGMNWGLHASRQTTLRDRATVTGIGVHSGSPVTLTLHPAEPDTGIVFVRCGTGGGEDREIKAHFRSVTATEFATVLGDENGPAVSTTEHVLSALRGLGVDNAVIEVDGAEVPIMDGSAAAFVAAIDQVGIAVQTEPRRYIQVLKPVRISKNGCYGELRPHLQGLRIESEIEFDHPLIGRQSLAVDVTPDVFRHELARARTFGFMRDVAKLWSAGYALGASLENTVVMAEDRVLNAEGMRFGDEFVRHKIVDAIGDLALAGAPLLATYRSVRSGHKLNHAVLTALMADPSAWTYVEMPQPARRARGHADLATGFAAPTYGPDVS